MTPRTEPQVLLMVEVKREGATELDPRAFIAAEIDGERIVDPMVAEETARRMGGGLRFLMLARDEHGEPTEAGRRFGEGSRLTLSMPPGQTIWDFGVPTVGDRLDVLREVFHSHGLDDMPSPDPRTFPIPAVEAIQRARERFGEGDADDIDASFVWALEEIGGSKHVEELGPPPSDGLPPATLTVYLLPLAILQAP